MPLHKCLTPGTQTLFVNRTFQDVIKVRIKTRCCQFRVGPKFSKRQERTHSEEGLVIPEADSGGDGVPR